MRKFIVLIIIALVYSCDTSTDTPEEVTDLRVNSYTVECFGVAEGTCLLVQEGDKIGTEDWSKFYFEGSIEGFDFEPGYIYDLSVLKTSVENPPQDGSDTRYELVRIKSKERA